MIFFGRLHEVAGGTSRSHLGRGRLRHPDSRPEEVEQVSTFQEAAAYAIGKHEGAIRKFSGLPYIVHPIEVASILSAHGADAALVQAGLLHDTVEDTDATIADIEARFGHDVARLVDSVTRRDGESYEYFLTRTIASGRRSIILKLADIESNSHTLPNDAHSLRKRYRDARIRLTNAL